MIEVKNFARAINATKDIAAFFEIRKIAKEIKPDIIHLHSSKAGALGRFAFSGKRVSLFYTPHGYSFLMENYKPMKRRVFKLIESVCAKRNCTTISCSVGEHQESLKLTKRATYVNNGINMAELQEIIDKTEKVEHPFTVYTLGRICYQKNPTLFNEIAGSFPNVKFVWIGDGELRGELTSKNIEITGWADRSTAIRYAVNADVFLLPSRWEGLPISLLESMYMKKICVVSNVIGNRDVIHNNVKFAMVLYDSFSNRSAQRAISLIPLFDKVFSFDEEDAKKHGLQHIYSTFSTPHYLKADANYKSSAFFIGTGVDREEELNEDLSYIASKIDGCKFGIVSVKNQRYKDLIEYNKPITYQEEQMYAYNTKCIVEIVKCGQSGITLRTCEAIAFNKKLLTNNASIKNLPFYDPRYMSVFETTKDIDIDFIRDNRKVDYKYDGYFSPKRIIKLLAEERW